MNINQLKQFDIVVFDGNTKVIGLIHNFYFATDLNKMTVNLGLNFKSCVDTFIRLATIQEINTFQLESDIESNPIQYNLIAKYYN